MAEDEIGRAGHVGDAEFFEADAEQLARGQHFGDVVFDVGGVGYRGLGGQDGERIHAVRRLGFVQVLDVGRVREEASQAHAGHAEHLGERAADEEVGDALDFGERGDAGEFVVGFVDHDDGLLRARRRMRSMARRLRPVPVGLLGLERMTARVSGVMASSTSWRGNSIDGCG